MSTALASAQRPSLGARNPRAELFEFLLIGGGTLVVLPIAWWMRAQLGLEAAELLVGFLAFHAASLINDPHFSVTYLLFYRNLKRRALGAEYSFAQRLRYWIAGALVPLALLTWGVWAISVHSSEHLGWMMQLMFFLVGWHYVKQGFGVLSVLSARRGVRFTARERGVILTHCISGWLFAKANPADPGTRFEEQGVVFTSFPHPDGVEALLLSVFVLSTLALAWTLLEKWRRDGHPPPFVPLAGLLITVWMWMVFSSLDPLLGYVIPALHSVQYLYFVWLLERNGARKRVSEERALGAVRYSVGLRLLRLAALAWLLGWALLHGVPGWLDATLVLADVADPLGPTPYLAVFVTVVNVHHYFMDSVIWRRDNPEMALLQA